MKFIAFICFVFVFFNLSAQKETNNWVFGDSLLMTFTDTGIYSIPIPSNIRHESSASISDSAGNLLFHANVKYVWNKLNMLYFALFVTIDVWQNEYALAILLFYSIFMGGLLAFKAKPPGSQVNVELMEVISC
jgi:hypothetical protein